MASIQLENLTSFGRLALALDQNFLELTRISGQLERLEIESDSGLDKGIKLLTQFSEHASAISTSIQDFSRILQDVRDQSQVAAQAVGARAQKISERKEQENQLREKLNQVQEKIQTINTHLFNFNKERTNNSTEETKARIRFEIERSNEELKKLLADARIIKEHASQSNFKNIEQDTQEVIDVLRSSSRKMEKGLTGSISAC